MRMRKSKWGKRKAYIDHPVGHLGHGETSCVTQLLLLLFGRVRMIGMTVKPVLEEISDRLGELSTLPWLTFNEGRGRSLGGTRRGRADRHGRSCGRCGRQS